MYRLPDFVTKGEVLTILENQGDFLWLRFICGPALNRMKWLSEYIGQNEKARVFPGSGNTSGSCGISFIRTKETVPFRRMGPITWTYAVALLIVTGREWILHTRRSCNCPN